MIANNFGRSVSTELKLFKTMDSCSMADWSRQDSSSKFRYEGNFQARRSIYPNQRRLQEAVTYTGTIGVARLFLV